MWCWQWQHQLWDIHFSNEKWGVWNIISWEIFLLPVVGNATANVHLIILSLLLCMSFDSSSLVPYYHATNHPYKWVQTIHNVENWEGKSLYHPLTYGGGLHNPPTYKTVYITPLNFSKPVKLPPKAVSKKHSKSQKNHKIENLIVLDSKWVDLYSEYIIWYALVYFFVVALDLYFSS